MPDISDLFEEAEPPEGEHDTTQPRWPHSELPPPSWPSYKKLPKRTPGVLVMQHGQFDIYVYPHTFMLRWGNDFYCKHHKYDTIKDTLDGKWQLPDNVQAAILAVRAMLLGEIT